MNVLIPLLVLDFLWIFLFMGPMYQKMLPHITCKHFQVNYIGVLLSYLSLYFLLVLFLTKLTSDFEAFLFGFLVYCVFDATNYALLPGWRIDLAVLDCLWGGTLFFLIRKYQMYFK